MDSSFKVLDKKYLLTVDRLAICRTCPTHNRVRVTGTHIIIQYTRFFGACKVQGLIRHRFSSYEYYFKKQHVHIDVA